MLERYVVADDSDNVLAAGDAHSVVFKTYGAALIGLRLIETHPDANTLSGKFRICKLVEVPLSD